MAAPAKILDLVERFDRNVRAYKQGPYNEAQAAASSSIPSSRRSAEQVPHVKTPFGSVFVAIICDSGPPSAL
jgi:hypothetical protein